jgi:hypothetical protein
VLDQEFFIAVRGVNTTCVRCLCGGIVFLIPRQAARFDSLQNTTMQHTQAIAELRV